MAETQRILVVEDDIEISGMLDEYFEAQGYEVMTTAWGENVLGLTEDVLPDLVVLDIHLPDIDGYEVCRRLRGHRRTEHIPVIFLTERNKRIDRLSGLELGAVDYITKPFDIQELRLRVRNALRRASLGTLVNPITGLPTDPLIDERLAAMLRQENWTLLSVGIQGLRDFSDVYGFVTSDDVLRAVALMLKNAAEDSGHDNPFIGHLGEADFLVISTPSKAAALRERIISRLNETIEYFYPVRDREDEQEPPGKLCLGIGMVTPQDGPFDSPMDVKLAALNSQDGV